MKNIIAIDIIMLNIALMGYISFLMFSLRSWFGFLLLVDQLVLGYFWLVFLNHCTCAWYIQ